VCRGVRRGWAGGGGRRGVGVRVRGGGGGGGGGLEVKMNGGAREERRRRGGGEGGSRVVYRVFLVCLFFSTNPASDRNRGNPPSLRNGDRTKNVYRVAVYGRWSDASYRCEAAERPARCTKATSGPRPKGDPFGHFGYPDSTMGPVLSGSLGSVIGDSDERFIEGGPPSMARAGGACWASKPPGGTPLGPPLMGGAAFRSAERGGGEPGCFLANARARPGLHG